jgi:hypothetical protein
MKNKILEGLKAKYPDIQDSVLSRIADKLAKTVTSEDQVETAVAGVTLQQVIDSYADSRVTEATSTAVANYEKKHGLKEGKPIAAEPQEPKKPEGSKKPDGDDTPEWAKKLIESNQALEAKIKAIEGEKVVTTRASRLEKLLEEIKAPEQLKNSYKKSVAKMNFENDEEFDTYLNEIKTEIEPLITQIEQKGVVFSTPPGGKGTVEKEPPAQVKERIEERKAYETANAAASSVIKGLPTK